jgi:flagellin
VLTGTKFNGTNLLNTSASLTFQVGADNVTTDQIDIDTTDLTAGSGVTAVVGGAIATSSGALAAMDDLDNAIDEITTARATFGAKQNRFDSVIASLQISSENLAASRGRIMDANFAVETSNLSRGQILQQAGTAMVAQANQLPQGVLSLLR